MEFYIHSNSAKNSLECTKAKLATHFLTELFPIYQNKYWAIRWQDNHTDISPYYIEDFRKWQHLQLLYSIRDTVRFSNWVEQAVMWKTIWFIGWNRID